VKTFYAYGRRPESPEPVSRVLLKTWDIGLNRIPRLS
jgi:hypothetical protein